MPDAIGMIEVEGVAGIIVGADAARKAANVELLGWESIGGFTTLFVRGSTADIDMALTAAESAAALVAPHVVTASLHQPLPETSQFVGFPLTGTDVAPSGALGLVETRGYGTHVDSNDRMVKAAQVQIAGVLTVHNRVVCSLVVGDIDDVEPAVAAAKQALSGSEWFMSSAVIEQPDVQVLGAFLAAQAGAGAA